MAQKVQIVLVDDLDGGPADEQVRFGLDGTGYEIDLSAENAARLRDLLAPYVAHGRRAAPAPRSRSATPRKRQRHTDTQAVRDWARERGIEVGERGRIPAGVQAQYESAHQAG